MAARCVAAVLAGALVALAGCGTPADQADTSGAVTVVSARSEPAAAQLEQLPVKGRAPKAGYSREEFGQQWADVDRNGCDQRNDVLARDLTGVVFKPGTHDCVVLSGTLVDPYTGRTIAFSRGQGTSEAVQIDHVVSLSDAWQKGAQQLDAATRERLANDPDNLLAVDGPTNAAKGDGDAATWLPLRRAFWCEYATRQVQVKTRYRLWVTAAERDALARALDTCSSSASPASSVWQLLPGGTADRGAQA